MQYPYAYDQANAPAAPGATLRGDLADRVTQPSGFVDFFGYCASAGGWLFCGWMPRPPRTDGGSSVEFLAEFERGRKEGHATLCFYQRDDLGARGIGIVVFAPLSGRNIGPLQSIMMDVNGIVYQALAGHTSRQFADRELVERVRPHLLSHGFADASREELLTLLSRPGYTGQDTLSSLTETVMIEVDEAILCPPDGVLLMGWQLSAPGSVKSIRVRSAHLSGGFSLDDVIPLMRHDVISAVGADLGFFDPRCGFIAYVPGAISPGDAVYLEVELHSGEVGFKGVKLSRRSGMPAVRRALEVVDVRYSEVNEAFDRILGPAVRALNDARLATPAVPSEIVFGPQPENPESTLIIPLYGRIDFVEYQMAFFSRNPHVREMEILYVLDDPPKRRELEGLAQSVYERFQIPFRLLLLSSNLGFAPANNVGLRAARGKYICYLNSDIFPITPDWMEQLVERLKQNPEIGIIGPQLLFEDGSVQHEGCFYRPIAEFANWMFVEHENKGRRPTDKRGLHHHDAITGACMVLERSLATELGGFDEVYIVGDFEDSDLCLKIRERGLKCTVDHEVQLYHLERKSQIGPGQLWRMNLTLYNAWVHQRRWFTSAESPTVPVFTAAPAKE